MACCPRVTWLRNNLDLQKVGQELGVQYVLSGNMRRVANNLRITAELSDVQTGSVIWVDRVDGDLTELFDLQERIAARIVWSLVPHLREAELKSARRKRPENMNAYDLLLQAIDLLYHMNRSDFARGGQLLRQAIAADDTYATAYAYASLADPNINQGWSTDFETDAKKPRGWQRRPSIMTRQTACARGLWPRRRCFEYTVATELFDRAIKAAPGNASMDTQ